MSTQETHQDNAGHDLRSHAMAMAEILWAVGITSPIDYIEQIASLIAYRAIGDVNGWPWTEWKALPNDAELLRVLREVIWDGLTHHLDHDLFQDCVPLVTQPPALRNLTDRIDALPWERVDVLGDIVEALLGHAEKGVHGTFRTPSHIVQFMVQAAAVQPGESVWDPACGTGSLLVETARQCPGARIHGSEIDRRMARLAVLNAFAHNLDPGVVIREDTLTWALDPLAMRPGNAPTSFDVILANPPFGGKVQARCVQGKKSSSSEIQFIAAILQRLAPGGRAVVVVPTGIFFAQAALALRRLMLDTCRLRVINLPSGVFQPYTDVATAILLLDKGAHADTVWFHDVRADGYSLTARRNPVDDNDLPEALAWLAAEPRASHLAWCATMEQIAAADFDLSPGRYRPTPISQPDCESPEDILAQILADQVQMLQSVRSMYQLLGDTTPLGAAMDAALEHLLVASHSDGVSDTSDYREVSQSPLCLSQSADSRDMQILVSFVDWLTHHGITLCQWEGDACGFVPLEGTAADLLAEYAGASDESNSATIDTSAKLNNCHAYNIATLFESEEEEHADPTRDPGTRLRW